MVHSVHESDDDLPKQLEQPEQPKYLHFPFVEHGTIVDGRQVLNRWSTTLTRGQSSQPLKRSICSLLIILGHDFPGAQV